MSRQDRHEQARLYTNSPILQRVFVRGWLAYERGLNRDLPPYTSVTSGKRWRSFANTWASGWDAADSAACERE